MSRQLLMVAIVLGIIVDSRAAFFAAEPTLAKIEFNRDVRPILSDKCFVCHGPDSAKRQAGLRLDQRESAVAIVDQKAAIVPGNTAKSELYQRVVSADPDLQMPPPDSTLKLSAAEIEILKRWIEAGAEYQQHWSFISPEVSVPPDTAQADGCRHPIDRFIRDRLDREKITAATEADRTTLIRRVSFDLVGLPPDMDEVKAFVSDTSPDAYEKLVDRLLASPRYGERMAATWLDAARYADTNGYQTDGPRFMWRWRDWVIDAFNQNQPFDEFTIDQLAGDLIEDKSGTNFAVANARLIATGFNRNHRGNAEGGIIPEEFRVEYVVDRVETTAAVWLGLTVGCARCHDHKYDPISQREFYQLFAYFNRVAEPGKYIRNDNSMPYLPAPTVDQRSQLAKLEHARESAQATWRSLMPQIDKGMREMAAVIGSQAKPVDWSVSDKLDAHLALDRTSRVLLRSPQAVERTADLVWKQGDPSFVDGRIGQAADFDGKRWVESRDAGDFGDDESFAISCWVKPAGDRAMTILARMDHDNSSRGYELRREANGHLQALFSGRILDDLIRIETKEAFPSDRWSHLFVSYDGSSAARGVAIRINGEPAEVTVITDLLSNPIRVKFPLCVGGGGSAVPFRGAIDELRLYRGRLTTSSAVALAAGDTISQIAANAIDFATPTANLEKLREFYLAEHASESERLARQAVIDTQARYNAYLATIPTTMVMQDRVSRETFMLKRGEYDKPGDRVEAAVPAILNTQRGSTTDRRQDRLELARWLVSRDNPLTARVTVNRMWQSLFGVGLVKTAEDFGTQGEPPSHPELLDWLAIDFSGRTNDQSERGWDVKRTLRQMVTSATYRQSSSVNDSLVAHDPDNRWLGRGPRFRLPAEMIRDAALASSGLLVETLGGRSVKPYQPAGLWEELSADAVPGPFSIYTQDHGAALYRRGIYTFRRRTVPPPALAIFDASPREACRVSLPRTNTPLQALNLMNDVTYVEAARVLAERAMKEGGASPSSRLSWAFQKVLSREASDRELSVLVNGFERRRELYQQHPDEAERLLRLGESITDATLPKHELAAYAATASVIFNIDEFVAKP